MVDSHVFVCVTDNFKSHLKENYNFDLDVIPIRDNARIYVCGKNTPSENYGVVATSALYEVLHNQPGVGEDDAYWRVETFPEGLLPIISFFDDPENENVDSNVADPDKKGDGFVAKFRFLIKRDRRWANNRDTYYLTFMLPDEVDMIKADDRYHDPDASAKLSQWG